MAEDLSNRSLSRFLSVEIVGTIVAFTFALGVSYATLTKAQESTDEKVDKIEARQEQIKNSVQTIEIDVAEIKANQKAQVNTAKDQQKDIDRILDILERRLDQ